MCDHDCPKKIEPCEYVNKPFKIVLDDISNNNIKLALKKALKNPNLKDINYDSKQNVMNTSPWREVVEILDLLTEGEVTIDTDNTDQKLIINIIANLFAEQLNLDRISMSENQP